MHYIYISVFRMPEFKHYFSIFFFLICYPKADNYNAVIKTGLIYFFYP